MKDLKKELLRLPNGENEASKKLADLYFKNKEWQMAIDGLTVLILRETLATQFLLEVRKMLYGNNL